MSYIFVVEDEFDIQELLKNYLEEAGYQVFCASDGVEAINLYEDQIKGYDLQVDEYVTKPFSTQVLLRKIGAVLRRSGKHLSDEKNPEILQYGDLKLDSSGYQVWEEERKVELTQKEFELLREFLLNKGRVLTRNQLLDAVWGADYFGEDRIVDTHIKNLRKKLAGDYIDTIRGVGYRIDKIHKKQN